MQDSGQVDLTEFDGNKDVAEVVRGVGYCEFAIFVLTETLVGECSGQLIYSSADVVMLVPQSLALK